MFRNFWVYPFIAAALMLGSSTVAQSYDLAEEFSYASNPFGYWHLYKAPGSLHGIVQNDFFQNGTNFRAWADQPSPLIQHVPLWSKVEVPTAQTQLGDVLHHTAELDRTFTQATYLTWTSPTSGRIAIEGMIWAPTGNNRVNGYQVRTNATSTSLGTLVNSGLLVSDGSIMRETALKFSDDLGGTDYIVREHLAGEQVTFLFVALSENGNLGDTLAMKVKVHRNPKILSGVVTLNDFLPNPSQEQGMISMVSQTTGDVALSSSLSFKADGSYSIVGPGNLPFGNYRVVIKASHWLAATAGVVNSDPIDIPGLDATLTNGDCDGDNEVGPGDFGILSAAFGSTSGDANWNEQADLDGDAEVGPSDFGILSANFGQAGD